MLQNIKLDLRWLCIRGARNGFSRIKDISTSLRYLVLKEELMRPSLNISNTREHLWCNSICEWEEECIHLNYLLGSLATNLYVSFALGHWEDRDTLAKLFKPTGTSKFLYNWVPLFGKKHISTYFLSFKVKVKRYKIKGVTLKVEKK